ncbi:MAG: class II aldolase/adducin family protein [Gammaproteobacteria bacterium]|jgi:hypothetical protein
MSKTEGVIKFDLEWDASTPWEGPEIGVLERWREEMLARGVLGQDADRYDGFGFGNLSARVPSGFLISGTQTGHERTLGARGYALVVGWTLEENRIIARGPVKPSSESLTHAALYQAQPSVRFVFHGHSPDLWAHGRALDLPVTDPDVPYGTPAMAAEVERLSGQSLEGAGILIMGGHEDGFIAFGGDAEHTGACMLEYLERAREKA